MDSVKSADVAASADTQPPDLATPRIDDLFICIGAQKAGTTWLARILSAHPDIFMTPVKELHYFDHAHAVTTHLADKRRRSRRRKYLQKLVTQWSQFPQNKAQWSWYRSYLETPIDDAWYARLFMHRSPKRFAGEATPEYAILGVDGFRHIHKLAPTARIVFILRNPVTRAWSQILHQCRRQRVDAASLSATALTQIMDEAPNFHRLCDYVATIDAVRSVFTPAQTLFVFYEEMHADREAALREVCHFIGVPFDSSLTTELNRRFNRSQDAVLPAALRTRLRDQLKLQYDGVAARLGRVPKQWTSEWAGSL